MMKNLQELILKLNDPELSKKVKEHYFELGINQRNYIAVIIVILVICVLSIPPLGSLVSRKYFFLVLIAIWSFSIIYDFLSLYEKYKENPLAKASSLIVYTLCTTAALAISSQIVNSIVGINPSKFPYTIAFLSICTIPFFVVCVFGILSIVYLFLFAFYFCIAAYKKETQLLLPLMLPWLKPTKDIRYKNSTRLFQAL